MNRANGQKGGEYPDGYPRLAEIQNSDLRLLMCRKFSALRARLLIRLQEELTEMEEDLESNDRHFFQEDGKRLISRRRDAALSNHTSILAEKIGKKLTEYGQSLDGNKFREARSDIATDELWSGILKVLSMSKPDENDRARLYNEVTGEKGLAQMESGWIEGSEDLMSLSH